MSGPLRRFRRTPGVGTGVGRYVGTFPTVARLPRATKRKSATIRFFNPPGRRGIRRPGLTTNDREKRERPNRERSTNRRKSLLFARRNPTSVFRRRFRSDQAPTSRLDRARTKRRLSRRRRTRRTAFRSRLRFRTFPRRVRRAASRPTARTRPSRSAVELRNRRREARARLRRQTFSVRTSRRSLRSNDRATRRLGTPFTTPIKD